jgi:hypothetical protein
VYAALVLALVAALGVAACGVVPNRPGATRGALDPDPSIAAAMEFRTQFGLRADRDWIVKVAADPSASSTQYGVPLLPDELADLNKRAEETEAIVPIVQAYGEENRDVFGGLYIDQASGGVVALFTRDVTEHQRALLARLKPGARVVVRQVRWSDAELRALQELITNDRQWLDVIPARLSSAATDTIGNVVELNVSSANPNVARLIIEHYNAAEKLKVNSDGTGALLQPMGRLMGQVVDVQGRPVARVDVEYEPLFNAGAMAGTGHITDADGRFEIGAVVPGKWRVFVMVEGTEFGSVEVDVPPGAFATARVVLTRPLPST